MNFDHEKKQALRKIDKSKKGHIDKQILSLVNLINNHSNYYTTSSCSGRIMLFLPSQTGKKQDAEWLFSSHEPVTIDEIKPYLKKLPKETLWLRMEPPILHICARNMEAADNLLKIANDSGFRRSSLLGFKNRIVIEIIIPEKLDAPISENCELIVREDYLKVLIKHANIRLRKSGKKLKKLQVMFKSFL